MDYRYFTLEKRGDAYRVYGWRALPDTVALQMQDFEQDVVAVFPDEALARRAYPQAKTILRGKSLLLRQTWPEEHGRRPKHWTMTFIAARPRARSAQRPDLFAASREKTVA
ncbi:MAG: hypothetical protein ACT4P4_12050 [Betaproteobacteria bacterium]